MRIVRPGQITRRGTLAAADRRVGAGAVRPRSLSAPCSSADRPAAEPNRNQRENARARARRIATHAGPLDRRDGCRSQRSEGYCSKQSVAAGEKLQIMVSTEPAEKFQIEIFRTGYYGGCGARRMTTLGPLDGRPQPTPKPGRAEPMHECRWQHQHRS